MVPQMVATGCYSCSRGAVLQDLAPHERIAFDELWMVAHAFDTALPGWLVLVPRRHVTAIAELSDEEAAALGTWQVRLSRALHEVTGCQQTYVAQFAESAGFTHVHFHVIPRPPDLASDRRGPRIFSLLGVPEGERVSPDRMDEIAGALSRQLDQQARHRPVRLAQRRWRPAGRAAGGGGRRAAVAGPQVAVQPGREQGGRIGRGPGRRLLPAGPEPGRQGRGERRIGTRQP